MAPKVKKAAKAPKAKAAKLLPAAPNLISTDAINAEIQAKLASADATIKDYYSDLVGKPTNSSGHAPYDQKEAAARLGNHQPYVCSCPFFWLNLGFEFQPNMPKYQKRIDNLENHFFATPSNLQDPVLVYLNPGECPHQLIGSLRAFDPPEMRDAMRQAIARAIETKVGKKVLKEWHEILMSIPFRFEAGVWGSPAQSMLLYHILYTFPFTLSIR